MCPDMKLCRIHEILKDVRARHEQMNNADDDIEELRVKIAAVEDPNSYRALGLTCGVGGRDSSGISRMKWRG
jgi:hypothetical protein